MERLLETGEQLSTVNLNPLIPANPGPPQVPRPHPRRGLEDDVAIQLKRYGFAGGRWLGPDWLSHIQRDDRATIDHFRPKAALKQHLRRIGADPRKPTPQQCAEAVLPKGMTSQPGMGPGVSG